MFYDEIGQPLSSTINATAFGLATTLPSPANVLDSTQVPRLTSFNNIPAAILPAAPKGGSPQYPDNFSITNSIDDNLKAPYSMNINASIGREFATLLRAGGLRGTSLASLADAARPRHATNLRDPKSGQTYFEAMGQLGTLLDLQGVSVANLPRIPFFENLWANAAGNGFTATQAVAKDYTERSNPGDFTNTLANMDNGSNCGANGSTFSATTGKITKLACGSLGLSRCGARSFPRSPPGAHWAAALSTPCSGPYASASQTDC